MLVSRLSAAAERCLFRSSTCVLLSFVHLLLKLLGLLFVDETQPSQTFLQLERVKEGAVLIVVPGIENLLIPNNSAT